jgi:hypothetical protein
VLRRGLERPSLSARGVVDRLYETAIPYVRSPHWHMVVSPQATASTAHPEAPALTAHFWCGHVGKCQRLGKSLTLCGSCHAIQAMEPQDLGIPGALRLEGRVRSGRGLRSVGKRSLHPGDPVNEVRAGAAETCGNIVSGHQDVIKTSDKRFVCVCCRNDASLTISAMLRCRRATYRCGKAMCIHTVIMCIRNCVDVYTHGLMCILG